MDAKKLEIDLGLARKGSTGLYVVHEPSQNNPNDHKTKNEKLVTDIVFVHGLNGHWVHSWTHQDKGKGGWRKKESGGIFWPAQLLPEKIPRARIMTYQYESKVWHNASKASVSSVAEQLLGLLKEKRATLGSDGPIVFVVHSLGGIIVKQAISTANDMHNQAFRDIADATRGIVFFGTPHRGSDVAKTLDPVHRITAVGWSRMRLLSLLTPHSHGLRDISDDFRHVAQRYALVTFYEQDIHPSLRDLIVDKSSAVMGIAHEDIMMLGGDHSSMCKFSQNDPRFDIVSSAIHSATQGLAIRGQSPAAASSSNL